MRASATMSSPAKPKAEKTTAAKAKPKQPSKDVDSGLLETLAQLREEVSDLRRDVSGLKTELDKVHSEGKADTIIADMVGQINHQVELEEASFMAEFEQALLDPIPVADNEPLESEADLDDVESAPEEMCTESTLAQHPELAEVMSAIEDQFPSGEHAEGTESEVAPIQSEDGDDGAAILSEDEIMALIAATSNLGAEEQVEPAQGTEISNGIETDTMAQQITGDAAMSVAAPEDNADTHIVSAAEIQAMLGIKDPLADSELKLSAPGSDGVEQDAPEEVPYGEVAESQVEPENAEQVDDPGLDLETIDPSAVAKVPGMLAAEFLLLPVCVIDDKLHCLCVEPFDQGGLQQVSQACGLSVVPHGAPVAKVVGEIRARYGDSDDQVVWTERASSKGWQLGKFLRRAG